MSIDEPGNPVHWVGAFGPSDITKTKPFTLHGVKARLTNKGTYRLFALSTDSPHEPWCWHFEWGPCDCGPEDGEAFV